MSAIAERYHRIKRWLHEYDKFVVNEREEDEGFQFSFWIWDKNGKKGLIPMLIGHLKKSLIQKNICFLFYQMNIL